MGTTWHAAAFGDAAVAASSRQIESGIKALLERIVRQMSHYDPSSDLSRYNSAPANRWVELPEELFHVLRCSLEIARAAGGWFDPTLGEPVSLWGFGPNPSSALPTRAEVQAALRRCGWQKLTLDAARRAAWQPGGLLLDLGGIAKGFAVDQLTGWLRRCGAVAALAEIGGEVAGFGVKPDGSPWWVRIEDPPEACGRLAETVIAVCDGAVATSGVWLQCRRLGAHWVSHLLSPHSGAPALSVLAATVLHESAMIADAWATAICAAPPRVGRRLACLYDLAARIVYRTPCGKVREWLSPALRALAA